MEFSFVFRNHENPKFPDPIKKSEGDSCGIASMIRGALGPWTKERSKFQAYKHPDDMGELLGVHRVKSIDPTSHRSSKSSKSREKESRDAQKSRESEISAEGFAPSRSPGSRIGSQ